ncbi:MAG: NAD(P)H-dependent oxidoreductase, partial [Actinomycetota bacterium]
MRILAFAASNSSRSINRVLLDHAIDLLTTSAGDDLTVETIDLRDYEMPIYSIDREEADGIPKPAKDFQQAITNADGLLIGLAEHNGNFTAAYKNLFDWTSRLGQRVYQDTPTVLLATSPGPSGGGNVLRLAVAGAPHVGQELLGTLAVPSFGQSVDPETGALNDPEQEAELARLVQALLDAVSSSADTSNST